MTFLRSAVFFVLLLGGHAVYAGQADLVIAATLAPPPPYSAGQSIQLTITITNLGPDVAGEDAVGPLLPVAASATVRFDDRNRLPVTFITRDAISCPLENVPLDPSPGQRSGILYVLYFPRLAVGETRSCTLDALIDVGVDADQVVTWTAFSAQDSDPNPGNNAIAILFSLSPRAIPGLGGFGLALLAILLLAAATRNRSAFT